MGKYFYKKVPFLRSIQWRLVIILMIITFILMTVVWVFLNSRVESIFYDGFKGDVDRTYKNLGIDEKTSIDSLLSNMEQNPLTAGVIRSKYKSYTIIDKSSEKILYSSDELNVQSPNSFRQEIYKSENFLNVLSSNDSNTTGQKQRYTRAESGDFYDYVKIQKLKDGDYILFFKYLRQEAMTVLEKFNKVIIISLVISLLAVVFLGYFLSKTITKPINNIMLKAEKITDGEFGYVLEVKSDDELGKLAKTFNFMSSRLKGMLTEITSEKNKVETILNYMTDGIIAYNRSGEVIHTNPASKKILNKHVTEIVTFDEFMNILSINLNMDQIIEENNIPDSVHKVQYKDKFLRVYLAAFANENDEIDGIISVIQDITKEHKLDNMRREFVANVSHELRTPLTSVKSYTETLLDGALQDRETAEHFLNVINDETDRMTRLVKDLLTLSQHDGGIQLNFEDISITDLVSSCIERLKREAEVKKQDLKLTVKQNMPLIKGDRYRIDQLLINIIGNAIKYTQERGRISVQLYCEKDYTVISVEDNGIGIPEQDLSRIFERFYRVDKARSRQMGGTGLGLAIAKEIAVLHGGNITAKSKLGKGTQIFVELPFRKRQQQTDDIVNR